MSPDAALVWHLVRGNARAAAVWGLVFGVVVYSSSATYVNAYPHPAQRLALARSLSTNVGLESLFGPARALDSVGGFEAWRSLGVLTIVGAVWGILTGTRMLRGEEEAGRWEVVLAGATTRGRAAGAVAVAGAVQIVEIAFVTALGALAGASVAHLPVSASLLLAVVLVCPAAVFLTVGLLSGQLVPTRSGAVRAAAAVFGACYLLRLVGVATGVGWLRWLTPLGWIDATHPMTGSDQLPFLGIAALIGALLVAAVVVGGRRDLGAGLLAARAPRQGTGRLLRGPDGLAVRLARPGLSGWLVGVAVMCGVLGLVGKSVGKTASQSQFVQNLSSRLGATHTGTVTFLGFAMIMVTTMIALAGAGFVGAASDDEISGRAEAVLVRAVSRTRWLAGRVTVALLSVTGLGLASGIVLWLASRTNGTGLSLSTLLGAGLNAVPVAVVVIGAGTLIDGLSPRLTSAVAYGLVAWSFLDELVGAAVGAPSWILDLSLLHHVALAPAADPRWSTNALLVVIGLAAATTGLVAFGRRDLQNG